MGVQREKNDDKNGGYSNGQEALLLLLRDWGMIFYNMVSELQWLEGVVRHGRGTILPELVLCS